MTAKVNFRRRGCSAALATILGVAAAAAQTTSLVSVALDGLSGSADSSRATVSLDGRYVAFDSLAGNLIPGDAPDPYNDIFVRDRLAGVTVCVSVNASGQQGTGHSTNPAISGDGRYVAFASDAPNLVPGDTNNTHDVFVHDRQTGATTRVSVTSAGEQATGGISSAPSISDDGRYVAFQSRATNLAPGDANAEWDVFLHDRASGQTILVSAATSGSVGNNSSHNPSVSGDGLLVAFGSTASDLIAGDTNAQPDIFVRDMAAGTTFRVSLGVDGVQGNSFSVEPNIARDGSVVAYYSFADNLVPGDTNGAMDVFAYDMATGQTSRVSVDSSGGQANGRSAYPAVSGDGAFVSFHSVATNLVSDDTNGFSDVFVHRIATGETVRVSVSTAGAQGNRHSGQDRRSPLSGDGSVTVFQSFANTLAPEDPSTSSDIFAHERTFAPCDAPVITSHPDDAAVCAAGGFVLSAAASGTPAPSWQWRKDGVAIPGAVESSYSVLAAGPGDAGVYSVTATNLCGAATSNDALVTVGTTIRQSPADQIGCLGGATSFSVAVAAPGTITYQWRRGGVDIPGAAGATLTIDPITPADAAQYDVVVLSDCGPATSAAATLTVIEPVAITTQPQPQTICAGTPLDLLVSATGGGTLAYQWRRDGIDIPGANGASLHIAQAFEAASGSYDVVISNACSQVVSDAVAVIVSALPIFTLQPLDQTHCDGDVPVLELTAAAQSAAPLAYQWLRDGVEIAGATEPTLTIDPVTVADTGQYQCVAANVCGSVGSEIADVQIRPLPVILVQPADTSACIGGPASFTVAVDGGSATYQWRKDGAPLPGATQATYTLNPVAPADAGSYDVQVTVSGCTTVSDAATLTVVSDEFPSVVTAPGTRTGCIGGSLTFTVVADGTAVTYQWQRWDGAQFVDIAGQTQSSFTISPIAPGDAGSYNVAVSNGCGTVNAAANLLIDDGNVTISRQPASTTGCEGHTAQFVVEPGGTPPFGFQWRKGGIDLPGATSNVLTIAPVAAADAGTYDVRVTSTCGGVALSDPATLTVVAGSAPEITVQPQSAGGCADAEIALTVGASGAAPLSYQWRKCGVEIAGATGSTLQFAALSAADAGYYDVVVSNPCGATRSDRVLLTVDAPPLIELEPAARTVGSGEGVTFRVEASGTAPLSYQWLKDGVAIAGAASSAYTIEPVAPEDLGAYEVDVTNACGTVRSAAAPLDLRGAPATSRVSVSSRGDQAPRDCDEASISGNGRYVAFTSDSTGLIPGPANNFNQVYLHDRQRGTTTRITGSPSGWQTDGDSFTCSRSSDGRYVAFDCDASNLVGSDDNAARDVFLLDTHTGGVSKLSHALSGGDADGGSYDPAAAAAADVVAYSSDATNLVAGDTNAARDIFVFVRATGAITRVSRGPAGVQADGPSRWPSISDDGRYVVFTSDATNLVAGDTNGAADVFLHDLQTGQTARVSLADGGAQADGPSGRAAISGDATQIAFDSAATNLLAGDANGRSDVFVRNLTAGTTILVSAAPDGQPGDHDSTWPAISYDGRHVAFVSRAANLVAGDTNEAADIFRRDRDPDENGDFDDGAAATIRVSLADNEFQADSDSAAPAISEDGQIVAFESAATNLVDNDTNCAADVFVRYVPTDSTRRASAATDNAAEGDRASGRPAIASGYVMYASAASTLVAGDDNGRADLFEHTLTPQLGHFYTTLLTHGWIGDDNSFRPQVSGDGRYVVFQSAASNLVEHDAVYENVFIREIAGGALAQVDVTAAGAPPDGVGFDPSVSADGRIVAFASAATNLVAGDTNGLFDAFIKDRLTGAVTRVSRSSAGAQANGASTQTAVSADGRVIAFVSGATNLVANDTNGRLDVFVHDRNSSTTTRVSVASNGAQANQDCLDPVLSADGRYVAFWSFANNLVAGDTNDRSDVFLHDRDNGVTTRVSVGAGGVQGDDGSTLPAISFDGRFVIFESGATNLVAADTNARVDVFRRDTLAGTTTRVSIDSLGQQALGGDSSGPAISSDARYVAFASRAANLVEGDDNGRRDIFVHDGFGCLVASVATIVGNQTVCAGQLATFRVAANGTPPLSYQWRRNGVDLPGATDEILTIADVSLADAGQYTVVVTNDCGSFTSPATTLVVDPCAAYTELVSVGNGGAPKLGAQPQIAADGDWVAFHSRDAGMTRLPAFGFYDVYVTDLMNRRGVLISAALGGQPPNESSTYPAISASGRFVAFVSRASNLVAGDTNNSPDVFVRDRDPDDNGTFDEGNEFTRRVSVSSAGAQAFGGSDFGPAISADGRFVAFASSASALASPPSSVSQIYVHDLATGETMRASVNAAGQPGADASDQPAISADGRYVAFWSYANNLAPDDGWIGRDVFVRDRLAGTTEAVSIGTGGAAAAGDSYALAISADGRHVVFVSEAGNLVPGDTNNRPDVFVRDRLAATTARVNLGPGGAQANGTSLSPSISADGEVVCFYSEATNLVPGDTNGARDAFIWSRETNAVTRVSVASNGAQANDWSGTTNFTVGRSITASGNGRMVAFFSWASNLAPIGGASPGQERVYVRDTAAALTVTASLNAGGIPGNRESRDPSVSGDGALVAFTSDATDLVVDDTNLAGDVFLRDRVGGATIRLTVSGTGVEAPPGSSSGSPFVARGGRWVAFYSTADDLVETDANGRGDVFVYDVVTGLLRIVSISSGGAAGNNDSGGPAPSIALSADGRVVAFTSLATNLVPADTNGAADVFVHDRDPDENGVFDEGNGITVRVNLTAAGQQSPVGAAAPALSDDGRFVAFATSGALVPGDNNSRTDIYVRDLLLNTIECVSVSSAGAFGDQDSTTPSLSGNGRYVQFASVATNLVPGDTNGASDVFVHDRQAHTTARISVDSGGAQAGGFSECRMPQSLSALGRYAVFASAAANLVPGDSGNWTDVFFRDRDTGITRRASINNVGLEGDRDSSTPAIAADALLVAFRSNAFNLVAHTAVSAPQIYAHDVQGRFGLAFDRPLRCDSNCDGAVNNFDIDAFVLALADGNAYRRDYPYCDLLANNDANLDGAVNNFDIDAFVQCLSGGTP